MQGESTEENIENETIVNEIIKNNPTEGDEMIQLIETLLSQLKRKDKS